MLLSSYISCAIAPGHGIFFFFFQAEDGIRDIGVTGVQTCALPICTILQNHTLRSARSTERGWSWYDGPLLLVKVPCLAYLARLRAAAGQQQHARTQRKQRCRVTAGLRQLLLLLLAWKAGGEELFGNGSR